MSATYRDRREQELRIDQMTVNIEKMRADMRADLDKQQKHLDWETRKFVLSMIVGAAACVVATAAAMNYFAPHPPPQVINVHLDAPLVAPATTAVPAPLPYH